MRPPSNRTLRHHLSKAHQTVDQEMVPAINQLLENDRLTQSKIAQLEQFRTASLLQRLRWIIRGTI